MKSIDLDQKDRLALLFRETLDQEVGVILLFEGPGLATIQYIISRLAHSLDPRHYNLKHLPHEYNPGRSEPFLRIFWLALPRLGDLVMLDRSYYYRLVRGIVHDEISRKKADRYREEIQAFERSVQDNGYELYRVYVNRSRKDLKKDARAKKDITLSLLEDRFNEQISNYKQYQKVFQNLINANPGGWIQIEAGTKRKQALLKVQAAVIARLEERLQIDSSRAVADFDRAMQDFRAGRTPDPSARNRSAPEETAAATTEQNVQNNAEREE